MRRCSKIILKNKYKIFFFRYANPRRHTAGRFNGTFFLVLVVMGVAVDKKAEPGFAGLSIGMTVAAVIVVLGAFTGASINPARTFGPYLMDTLLGGANLWAFFPIYLIGSIVGGILAALVYNFIAKGNDACALPQPFNED